MKKRIVLFVLLLVLLAVSIAYAHEEEQNFGMERPNYPISQIQAVGYGAIAFVILCFLIILFNNKMNEMAKKLVYSLLLVVVALVTVYLAITTIHTNMNSATKGPVHWHADYEIWICDNKLSLIEPEGMSNRQGTGLLHAHNDNRIHVEGVLMQQNQASLAAFFHAVGGYLSDDEIQVPADDGLTAKHNGDFCNGRPAKLYVFVNGNLIGNPANHAIAPFEKVPPGDKIKFIFTEKPIESINPNIG